MFRTIQANIESASAISGKRFRYLTDYAGNRYLIDRLCVQIMGRTVPYDMKKWKRKIVNK